MSRKLNQPLRWHGGKHYLAGRIVDLMPPHKRYLEPFAGGLSVLLAKPFDGIAEWVNDTNWGLTNFWRAIQSPDIFEVFKRIVDAIPLSESVWENSRSLWMIKRQFMPPTNPDQIAACAAIFFVMMRQSRQGLGKDYCTPTSRTRRGMNEQVSSWLTAVDGLPEIHARLRRVEVWNRPAIKAIRELDGENLLIYCDPPYVHSTRTTTSEYGDYEMSEHDHRELLETLSGVKGMFMLSGYRCELYDDFASDFRWQRVDFDLPNNASSKSKKSRKTECVWFNFEKVET